MKNKTSFFKSLKDFL